MKFIDKNNSLIAILKIILGLLFIISFFTLNKPVLSDTIKFDYQNDNLGTYISNGISSGNTHNYAYGNVNGVPFDQEGFVNYSDKAYLKKTVKENNAKQGLFDVTLDIKGNQINHPIDIVFVIDFSSSMTGEKLNNTLKGLEKFGSELKTSLQNGNIRVGIVAYNRNVYSTGKLTNDISELEYFLKNTAESHSGTFIQKGLIEGQKLLENNQRPDAEPMLIHIGDGSANRSYLPVPGATNYLNNGEIIDYNNYHTETYNKDFQTDSELYHTSDKLIAGDTNGTVVDKKIINDETLGSVIQIKESGINCYSIGVSPSLRGEYIARNIASTSKNYFTIDENLSGLGEALSSIADKIDKTISNGSIKDPMGDKILLQGSGNFTPSNYQLQGWRKESDGIWSPHNDLNENVQVTEENQTITVSHIVLGENERLTLTYQIRLNTETTDFKGENWYLCNGVTTLDPDNTEELLQFPVPSIKAPKFSLTVEKHWENINNDSTPSSIDFVVIRHNITSNSWDKSDNIILSKKEGYKQSYSSLPVNKSQSDLPLYNNNGDNFIYEVNEINVPDEFESTVTKLENHFLITNRLKTNPTNPSSSALPSQSLPVAPKKVIKNSSQTQDTHAENLPETGDQSAQSILIGAGLFILGGSLYFFKGH